MGRKGLRQEKSRLVCKSSRVGSHGSTQVCLRSFSKRACLLHSVISKHISVCSKNTLQSNIVAASLSTLQAEMENTKPEPDLTKIHNAVEAALTKIQDAQIDNHDPRKTKEDTDCDLAEASNLLAQAKENIATYVLIPSPSLSSKAPSDLLYQTIHRY